MIDPYEELANAIVLMAVKDYRKILIKLKKHPYNKGALYTKEEIERFFASNWYSSLTKVDSKILMDKLNQEVMK